MAPMGDGECGVVGRARPGQAAPAGPEGWRRYLEVNAGFTNPLAYQLSNRGFFSEVLVLVDGMLLALMERRRLIVGAAKFNGLRWGECFQSELPIGPRDLWLELESAGSKIRDKNEAYWDMRRWIDARRGGLYEIPELGLSGDDMAVRRWLLRSLCQPTRSIAAEAGAALRANGLVKGAFSAIHVRRGDKVAGVMKNGRLKAEGEAIPVERYAELIHQQGPGTPDVLVMTDDYSVVEELSHPRFGLRVVSLCPPEERGYDQPTFDRLAPEIKQAGVRRLLVETEIAIRSGFFAGGYMSNVGRYIATVHARPDRCVSVDSQKTPWAKY